jgi:hypothetical protein
VRRLAAVSIAVVVVAVFASSAYAVSVYAGPKQWTAGEGAGSSFSDWSRNDFAKYGSGHESTVTFIDNVTYGWHATVRNSADTTHTFWGWNGMRRKGHCLANASYFSGSCYVY